MQIRKYIKVGLLPLLTLPLMGESCTEEKVVSLSVGVDTTAEFIAQGSENWHDDTDVIDVKEQTDLADVLDDNDIDPNDVESIKVSRVFYKITVPDPVAGRFIEDGDVAINRVGVQTSSIISNFSGPADAVTDWIEVTHLLNAGGVTIANDFLAEYLAELQTGVPTGSSQFIYSVDGVSTPAGEDTNFQWALKVSFSVKANETVEVPNF